VRVVLFHPVRLPPRNYGGIERVVLWLAEALRDLGHEVHLAALEGSRLPEGVRLIPIPVSDRSARSLYGRVPSGVDILHLHSPVDPALAEELQEKLGVPNLTTIHGNGKPGERFSKNTVFLSRDHADRHGSSRFVHNGVNPVEFKIARKKRKGAPIFLSKTGWKVKNLAGAIRIADQAKMRLTITGGYRPFHLLLKTAFSPHEWVGPVSGGLKATLLAQASSLLFPVKWPEPFGLVMVESMLSGTPVVAHGIGSVPEVVGDWGGYVLPRLPDLDQLTESASTPEQVMQEWVEALRSVEGMSPEGLRSAAIERFSHHKMAEAYLALYREISKGGGW
jgi:glycosyltransferase involved in cell wall biosynthesis